MSLASPSGSNATGQTVRIQGPHDELGTMENIHSKHIQREVVMMDRTT